MLVTAGADQNRTAILKEVCRLFRTEPFIGPEQERVRTDETEVMERIDHSRTARAGHADQIVTKAEKIVKVDDLRLERVENALKAPTKKRVRPGRHSRVLGAIDTVVGRQAGVRRVS
jgi:hypothetical protein